MSRSSTEAEYRAMATTTAKIVRLQQLLKDLHYPNSVPSMLHCDNISDMALATNPILHFKAKHIEVNCHFVRERVQQGLISLQFVSSTDQYADILTNSCVLLCLVIIVPILCLGLPNIRLRGNVRI